MKTKLQAWKLDTVASGGNSHCWSLALSEIALSMNHQSHSSLGGRTSYKVRFNRKPRWEEAIPIHSRLQQTLNCIPDEGLNYGTGILQNSLLVEVPEVEIIPTSESINTGAYAAGYSFDSSDDSGMSDASLPPNHEQEAEELALPIPDIPAQLGSVSINNRVVRTVLEEAMQSEAAKARARSTWKYNKQNTIERFSAGEIVTQNTKRGPGRYRSPKDLLSYYGRKLSQSLQTPNSTWPSQKPLPCQCSPSCS